MALYDALQKRLNKATTPLLAEAGATNAGSTMASIAAAKGGKAGTAPTASPSLAEQAAASGAATDVQQAASQNALQAQALGMAEQGEAAQTAQAENALTAQMQQGQQQLAAQATTQRANLAQSERLGMQRLMDDEDMKKAAISSKAEQIVSDLLSNRKLAENDIFASFAQDERELEFRRDAAAIEQMGTMLALRDRAYVDELRRVGAVRNLESQNNFEMEATRLAMGDNLALYLDKLGWTERDLTDNLRFAEKMAQMDINQAWAIMKMASDSANASMIASGATAAASAGIQYAAGKDWSSSSTPNSDNFAAKPQTPDFSVSGGGHFDVTK